jgi:hypothetical protein
MPPLRGWPEKTTGEAKEHLLQKVQMVYNSAGGAAC